MNALSWLSRTSKQIKIISSKSYCLRRSSFYTDCSFQLLFGHRHTLKTRRYLTGRDPESSNSSQRKELLPNKGDEENQQSKWSFYSNVLRQSCLIYVYTFEDIIPGITKKVFGKDYEVDAEKGQLIEKKVLNEEADGKMEEDEEDNAIDSKLSITASMIQIIKRTFN